MASSCRLGYLHFIFKVVDFVQFTALKQPIYSFKAADLAKLVLPSGWSIFEFKQRWCVLVAFLVWYWFNLW